MAFPNVERSGTMLYRVRVSLPGWRRAQTVTPPTENVAMERQLTLMESPKPWRLSERTREIGLKGIAEARAALAQHRPEEDRAA